MQACTEQWFPMARDGKVPVAGLSADASCAFIGQLLRINRCGYDHCLTHRWHRMCYGQDDMFWDQPWDEAAIRRSCWDKWRVVPRPMWAAINWGGRHIQTASNIVFSNGKLDPWSGGGVLEVCAIHAPQLLLRILLDCSCGPPLNTSHLYRMSTTPSWPSSSSTALTTWTLCSATRCGSDIDRCNAVRVHSARR